MDFFTVCSLIRLIYVAAICSPALQGCSFTQEYPSDWPMPMTTSAQACPDISGIFRNLETDYVAGKHLAQEFTNYDVLNEKACTYCLCDFCNVKLEWSNQERTNLQISLLELNTDEVLETLELDRHKGHYNCKEDKLITSSSESHMYLVEGLHDIGTREFFLAKDGALIMEYKGFLLVHVLVVPTGAVYGNTYSRWVQPDATTPEEESLYTYAKSRKESLLSREEACYKINQRDHAIKGGSEEQLQLYYDTVGKDPESAHHWLCKSAEQNNQEARYRLAIIYENGVEGINKDYRRAYIWYSLSAESGSYWGMQHALRIKSVHLDDNDIAVANEAIRDWHPGQCENELGITQKH